ncbi:MAG: flagellar biosynthetic protein FliR [Clostridia bacterium]|nr:flagellar biosynthetic protein FliR [Clostridia bacterium]
MAGLSELYSNIDVFLLVLVRMSTFVFVSPVFGRKGIPNTTKIGFSFFLSYIVFFNFDVMVPLEGIGNAAYLMIIFREALIGMAIGFVSIVFFAIFYTAGQIADFQMGFNIGGMYDQQMQTKVPIVGNLFYVMAFLTFLNLNGMETLTKLVANMYYNVPIIRSGIDNTIYKVILTGFYTSFMYAVKIVLPMVMLMIITQFLLGVVIKFVPQMNVFIIGIPIKIVLSLMLLIFMITPLYNLLGNVFKDLFEFSNLAGMKF